jgi:hypothetical protein
MNAKMRSVGMLAAGLVFIALMACGCGKDDKPSAPQATCADPVDMFPVPVSDTTSPFPGVDDVFLEVPFTEGFTFTFYGTTYSSVFLNSNAGLTFGAGTTSYDIAATEVTSPGIAVFWGDMDAGEYTAETRANQFVYRQCEDRFEVTYTDFQDNDEETWNNTATITLYANGTVKIAYGDVASTDILVGIFDGTHASDQRLGVQATYANYPASGSGIILFDGHGVGPDHAGELSGQTIRFNAP